MSLELVPPSRLGHLLPGEGSAGRGALARTPGRTLAGERNGLVTRSEILTGEKKPAFRAVESWPLDRETPFFVDWLTISQEHPEKGLPVVDSGCVMACDDAGELVWKTVRAVQHQGSFETSISVKCDGVRVTLSGNLSRFGRAENLFGFGFAECIARANEVLAHYGLPPFTAGQRIEYAAKKGKDVRYAWTGARVSRIDLTANYEAGSADDAHAVMQYLGTQHAGRHEGRVLGQGETVAWGGGKGARSYWKAYLKHLELRRHECADERVAAHCEAVGLVRFEGTVRTKALTDMGAAFLGDYERGFAMQQLVHLFNDKSAVLTRAEKATDDLDELPRHLRATARDYLAGMDTRKTLSQATWYRHRNELLKYGLDLAVRNVRPFTPRVRVVELRRAERPSWYQLAA
ncbi:DNA replication protein [Mitsuaria sp. WAJ17]|uniref:phage/plasmid replication domain-containing protein n=1 Tax=Mitsuaria sp. WAJ17 TaxID=2761452 RepID=UPI0015FF17FD|nr:phage/plasmid replication protein [Mitsuaria sp. WAJ17]MBB2487457.1 DNA replication protein [Mitsuaria sp. WAJ17]